MTRSNAANGKSGNTVRTQIHPRATIAAVAAAFAAAPFAVHAAESDDSGKLEEIVVTAQKRTENLQEVPVAIQALGTQKLEEMHIQSLDDYVKIMPSVSIQRSQGEGGNGQPGTAHIFIRGITSGGDGNHSGPLPSVGTYLDEQPTTTIDGALDVHIYDIERVEVLEGPQGTLYGASSEAGTIRVISNKPDPSKFSASYDVSIDTVKHGSGLGHTEEGYINLPITQNAAVRLVGWQEHDAGFIDNVAGTNAAAGIVNGIRTYPSSGDTISAKPFLKNGYNTVDIKGGRGALKVDLDDNWTITPTVMAQSTKSNGSFGYDPTIGDLQVTRFAQETASDAFVQSALTIEGHLHDFDITYAGAYLKRDSHTVSEYSDYTFFYDSIAAKTGYTSYAQLYTNNAGANINPTQMIYGDSWFTKMSQELRVTTPKRYPVKGTFGLFEQRQVHEIYQRYAIPGLNTLPYDPNTNPYTAIPGFQDAFYMADEERIDRDRAVFAQGTWDIDPHWSLTGGLRQFWFDNTLDGFFGFRSSIDNPAKATACGKQAGAYDPTYRPFHGAPCSNLDGETKDSGHTPLLTLTFFGDDDFMMYGTMSKGFRPGGVNRAIDPSTGHVPPPYKTEYLSNFELGWKSRWLDHHLRWNGAIFRENWSDFQFAHLGQNSITLVTNAGGARINGVESDVDWSMGGGFVLSANFTLLDAKLTQDVCCYALPVSMGGAIVDIAHSGDRLPVSPRFKGNLVGRYNFHMGDWKSNVQGTLTHQTSVIPVLAEPEAAITGTQPGFSLFDLSAGAEHAGSSFTVFISNLFDERAQLTRYNTCRSTVCNTTLIVPAQPRTIGFKFGQSF